MSEVKKYGLSGAGSNLELGKGGPRVVVNGVAIDVKNAANNALANLRAASPVGDNDVVTLKYLETQAQVSVVGEIYDNTGSVAVYPVTPSATQMYVCTSTSGAFTIKKLYRYVSGTATVFGSWEEYVPFAGMRMAVTIPLTLGTDNYSGDHLYLWDAEGATWVDIGPSGAETRVVKSVRGTLAWNQSAGAFNIGATVPSGARALRSIVSVTTAFDGTGGTLTLGSAGGSAAEIAPAAEIDLKTLGTYISDCYVKYAAPTQLIGTLVLATGSPTAGAADIEIAYSIS